LPSSFRISAIQLDDTEAFFAISAWSVTPACSLVSSLDHSIVPKSMPFSVSRAVGLQFSRLVN
jgi:hypothetical protein